MNKKHLIATILSLILVAFILPATTLAAPPANDNFGSATLFSALPFSDLVSNTDATIETDEPQWYYYMTRTVWYSFTPVANAVVRADMSGSSFYDTNLNVYQATGPGFYGLGFMGNASYGGSVTFSVQAGATYYIQAGDTGYYGGGDLRVNLQEIPPPPNDDFTDATVISPPLPFSSDTVDTIAATTEPGEPTPSCAYTTEGKSVWYAFTPSESGSVSASASAWYFSTLVAAYTGDSLTNLIEVGCSAWGGWLTFHVDAGTTYYFQARGVYNEGGSLQFNLQVTPPPVANFYFYPYDPTFLDTIQFYDNSYDPVGAGIQSWAWDFGDGSTATGCCPTHRYAADGDYTVQLRVTTYDGRTASASQLVMVRTHDVAITRFSAPQAASSRQTRQISVGINSKRNSEYVQVQIFKSGLQGLEQFGSLTQSVPVRPSNRTTDFNFSYTFTNDDASIGKVTFKAVAAITNARDALPADNEAIASPTKVSK
jgi:PKD repeat protein